MNSFHIVTQLIILCKKKIKKVTRREYITSISIVTILGRIAHLLRDSSLAKAIYIGKTRYCHGLKGRE